MRGTLYADEQYEWDVIYQTRLGILCGSAPATPEQEDMAEREADDAVEAMRKPAC